MLRTRPEALSKIFASLSRCGLRCSAEGPKKPQPIIPRALVVLGYSRGGRSLRDGQFYFNGRVPSAGSADATVY